MIPVSLFPVLFPAWVTSTFNQALMGHSCQAPKTSAYTKRCCGMAGLESTSENPRTRIRAHVTADPQALVGFKPLIARAKVAAKLSRPFRYNLFGIIYWI